MEHEPTLLRTLKLAMKQLETAGSQAQPDADFVDARPDLREWIKAAEIIEEEDPRNLVLNLQGMFLDRKGIFVAARIDVAAAEVDVLADERLVDPAALDDVVGDVVEDREVGLRPEHHRDIGELEAAISHMASALATSRADQAGRRSSAAPRR